MHEAAEPYEIKILNGNCKTLDAYKHAVGILKGLTMAEQALHDTIKHLMEQQEVDSDIGIEDTQRRDASNLQKLHS